VISPVKVRVFVWSDLLPIGISFAALAGAIGAHLTPQDTPIPLPGWIILWAVVAGFFSLTGLMFLQRRKLFQQYKFICDGIVVGWTSEKFAVKPEEFQEQLTELLAILAAGFPDAIKSLQGCAILFREEKWSLDTRPGKVEQFVAGLQDGMFIQVGWNSDLNKTALKHELTHRVFQVYAGDPPQAIAHAMMAELGIL
jgi:hypothetical protein